MSQRRNEADDEAAVASTVQRLGVLMAAGVAPASAWRHLAEMSDASEVATVTLAQLDRGLPVEASLVEIAGSLAGGSADAWRALAAAWRVAGLAGAPLAPTLESLAVALRDLAQTRRNVETARAGPLATARMVMALPFVGILFGLALGFDTVGVLLGSPAGLALLGSGVTLMLLARAWNRRLVRGAEPKSNTPGLAFDLLAIALSGGASPARAREDVTAAMRQCSLSHDELTATEATIELSLRAGVPAGVLLRAEAGESRRIARSEAERSAAKLSISLMMPLGLCILPAFMMLGVAPLMLTIVGSSLAAF